MNTDSQATPKNQSWRETLPVHLEADLYPLLSKTDPALLKKVGEDIRENGLKVPIVILREGDPLAGHIDCNDRANYKLVDGRNRLDAMAAVGVHFELIWKKGTSDWNWILVAPDIALPEKGAVETVLHHDDPAALVASLNLHRRHLTVEERHEKLVRMLSLHPEKSNRTLAAETGVSEPTVRRARSPASHDAPATKRVGRDGKAYRPPSSLPPGLCVQFDEKCLTTRVTSDQEYVPGESAGDESADRAEESFLEQAEALIKRAEAGEPVSAVAALVALKQEPAPARSQPMPICEELVAGEAREAQAKAMQQSIGENSRAEIERLRVRIGELEDTNRRLELRAIGLESEIAELRANSGSSIDRILETLERRIPEGNKAAHQCMRALRDARAGCRPPSRENTGCY